MTGYTGPGLYVWSPRPDASARYFVRPAPTVNDPNGAFLAFYEAPDSDDWVALIKRRYAEPFIEKMEGGSHEHCR